MRREGFGAVEALVALLLLLGLLRAGWGLVLHLNGVVRRTVSLADAMEGVRVVWLVLGEELRAGDAVRDGWVVGGDSVRLRLLRGGGPVCDRPSDSTVVVTFSGWRSPKPHRDSVLLFHARGEWTAHGLLSHAGGGSRCGTDVFDHDGPPSRGVRWTIEPGAGADPVYAFLFERASYHLADSAFRRRVGGGGRRPLTPEVFETWTLRRGAAGGPPAVIRWDVTARGRSWRGLVRPRTP